MRGFIAVTNAALCMSLLQTPDEVDGAACAAGKESGLLSMFLLPPVKGTFLTTMILWVGWSLISRTR